MNPFDKADRHLLYLLDVNARVSVSDLARTLKLGRDLVEYRLDRFEREGIVRRHVTVINPSRLGWTIYKTFIRLRSGHQFLQKVLDFLLKDSRVWCFAVCDGRWDLMVSLLARDPLELFAVQEALLAKFGVHMREFQTAVIASHRSFARRYLLASNSLPVSLHAFSAGGTPQHYELDETDTLILEAVSTNARADYSELGEQANVSPNVARYRLQRLEEREIILGYRAELDREKLGITHFRLQLHEDLIEGKARKNCTSFCESSVAVSSLVEQIGAWRRELTVELDSHDDLYKFIDQLRGVMKDSLSSVDVVTFRHHSFRWLPPGLTKLHDQTPSLNGNDMAVTGT